MIRRFLLHRGLGKMSFGVNFSKVAPNGKQLHISTAFKLSNIAGFRTCENLIFGPLFPLVGRVGENGFWYNNKSG